MNSSKLGKKKLRKRKRKIYKPLRSTSSRRLGLVFSIICLGIIGLIVRLAWLQVFQSPRLEARARARQTLSIKPLSRRMSIVDRQGRLLALDEDRYRLWAHPKYFNFPGDPSEYVREPIEVARKLALPLQRSIPDLIKNFSNHESGVKLSESLDGETANQIKELGISGIDLEPYLYRVYPRGHLFANVIGFLNFDRIPQAGLEQSLNSNLIQNEETRILRFGADGTPFLDDLKTGVLYGGNSKLQLTLDSRLQELAFNGLKESLDEWDAKKGVAIVMDVKNGALLALASTPSYDPNKYWKYSPSLYREWSVQDLIEPGSTFKPINLALALEERVITPHGKVNDNGIINVGGWPIFNHDMRANGLINFARVLQVSSNVGMVNTMKKLDPSIYWDWLHKLGVDARPDTDLPGAVAGQLKNKGEFIARPIEPAVASYGQGFSLTPLKLAQLHAFLANGGNLVIPHITYSQIKDFSHNTESTGQRSGLLRSEVTQQVLEWMESVVETGSGIGVKTHGYRIGGKTGTAEKVVNGKYQEGVKICSFVATIPVNDPRYVVLVVVDEPKGEDAFGSTVAVPVAKKIIDGLIVLEKIPPSNNKRVLKPAKG